MEHRGRRRLSPEGSVVARIDPAAARSRLALRQNRHGRVVGVQPIGREDMRLDAPKQW